MKGFLARLPLQCLILRKGHAKLASKLDTLESRVNVLDARMHEMLQHQRVQTDLLQHLLMASGISVPRPPALDENKKGEKEPLPSPAKLVSRIPPPYYTANELKAKSKRDSIKERLDQLMAKKASSTSQSTATVVPTSFPTTTTILRVITPEIVIPSKKEKGEPSILNEFKAILSPINSGFSKPGKDSSSIYFPPAMLDKIEYKLLGQEIKCYKDSTNEALKAHFAIIDREGRKLFIGTGHPHYSFAKAEEVARECEEKKENHNLLLTKK